MTKCFETHRACQESLCVMLRRTQVAFFLKTLVLDTVGHAQSSPRHFINSLPQFPFLASGVKVIEGRSQLLKDPVMPIT